MDPYDPTRELAAFAAGGVFANRSVASRQAVLVEIVGVHWLERIFARQAAGHEYSVSTWWAVRSPIGHIDSLVALTVRFEEAASDLRLLFWLRLSRGVLQSLVSTRTIILMSSDAFEATLAGKPHPEAIQIPLQGDPTPVVTALDSAEPSFAEDTSGWAITPSPTASFRVRVEARQFADDESLSTAWALATQEDEPGLVPLRTPTLLILTGLQESVTQAWTSRRLGGQTAHIPEGLAREAFAAFQKTVALEGARTGAVDAIHVSPVVQTVRVVADGNESQDIFYMAYSYSEEAHSLEAYQRLTALPEDCQYYVNRFAIDDSSGGHRQFILFASAIDTRTKDRLITLDWGDGSCITAGISDTMARDFLCRSLNLASDAVSLQPVGSPLD